MRLPPSLLRHAGAVQAGLDAAKVAATPNGSQVTLNRIIVIVIDPFAQTVTAQTIAHSPAGLHEALGYRDPVHNANLSEVEGLPMIAACRQHHEGLAIYYENGHLPPRWSIRSCKVTLMDKAVLYARDPQRGIVSVRANPTDIRSAVTWLA